MEVSVIGITGPKSGPNHLQVQDYKLGKNNIKKRTVTVYGDGLSKEGGGV